MSKLAKSYLSYKISQSDFAVALGNKRRYKSKENLA